MYSTFLGGSGQETVTGIAVDSSGQVLVTGGTLSTDFPLAAPFSSTYSASCLTSPPPFFTTEVCHDAFLAQLNAEGSALLFSTFLDCVTCDDSLSLSLDASGSLFLAGGGGVDVITPPFLAKLDFSGKPTFAAGDIVNAASFLPGAVAPGEIIEISGTGLGPILVANLPWDKNASRTSLGATRLLFDGVAAPLIQVEANRVRAVVPYEVAGSGSTRLVVDSAGTLSDPGVVPVVSAAPGIFTWNLFFNVSGMGLDRAFVYNEDGKQNTPLDPASRGSVIVFYATGEGQTDPAGVDGQLAAGNVPRKPLLPVSVRIGGEQAEVLYAGSAPGFVSGLMELHVRVPGIAATGDALPIRTHRWKREQPARLGRVGEVEREHGDKIDKSLCFELDSHRLPCEQLGPGAGARRHRLQWQDFHLKRRAALGRSSGNPGPAGLRHRNERPDPTDGWTYEPIPEHSVRGASH